MKDTDQDHGAGLAAGVNNTTVVPADAASHAEPTPGPWHIDRIAAGPSLYVIASDGEDVARVRGGGKDSRPNAHLIAAAPDLLTACKEAREVSAHMMRFIADNVPTDAMLRFAESMENAAFAGFGVRLQDAIAKAEGRDRQPASHGTSGSLRSAAP
jgi:hypothetical protein